MLWKNARGLLFRLMPAVFMVILLLRTAFIIFEGTEPQGVASDIDVITRTSCAALYAYIISLAASDGSGSPNLEGAMLIFIGLFCLGILFAIRGHMAENGVPGHSATASLVQMRDFLSGCIGFLVSRKKK